MTTYFNLLNTVFKVQERMQKHRTADIARVSGLHRNTVRQIRNGINRNPSIETLNAIHRALDSMEGVEND